MAYEREQQEFTTRVIDALRNDHVGKQLNEKQIGVITDICRRSFEESNGYPLKRILHAASVGIRLALGEMRGGIMDTVVEMVTGDHTKRFEKSDEVAIFNIRVDTIIRDMLQAREGSERVSMETPEQNMRRDSTRM